MSQFDSGSAENLEPKEDSASSPADSSPFRSLRVWPACILVAGMVATRYVTNIVDDGPPTLWMVSAFGPMLCGIAILLWWLLLSRARWQERVLGFVGILAVFAIALTLVDKTMRGPATMGLTIPMGTAGFAIGATACAWALSFRRTVVAITLASLGFGYSTLLRSDGMWGNFELGLHWRWEPTAEEKLLARRTQNGTTPVTTSAVSVAALMSPDWPEFRGPNRDGRQRGVQVLTDWNTAGPEELWKVPVGPGWSSFCVAGNVLFTQEQRGAYETIVCYDSRTGGEIWTQAVEGRLDDTLGGPGPRATPTLSNGRLFITCATGPVLRLDPADGRIVWQSDLRQIAEREPPVWGFCASPLVVESVVIIHAGGKGDRGTIALDVESGNVAWMAPAGEHSYSSPQLNEIAGERLVLMLTNTGLDLLDPATGSARLNYEWTHEGYRALQPPVVDGNAILLPTGMGTGTRRIEVTNSAGTLRTEDVWTSRHLKPDFNDCVVFNGHLYGFDGAVFTCIDLGTGQRKWKGGRYGKGQTLLLQDSQLLLVVTERGEVVVVNASPDSHDELSRFQALEGRTWNHPVVVGDRLFVRNSEQAACFKLPTADSPMNEAGG